MTCLPSQAAISAGVPTGETRMTFVGVSTSIECSGITTPGMIRNSLVKNRMFEMGAGALVGSRMMWVAMTRDRAGLGPDLIRFLYSRLVPFHLRDVVGYLDATLEIERFRDYAPNASRS